MLDPPVVSLNCLSWMLGIRRAFLEDLASNAVRHYHPFRLERTGRKPRWIDHPDRPLRGAQRKIYTNLLRAINLPEYLHGGVKGRSPLTNARFHLGKRLVLRIDLKDFFPSVTDRQVYFIWRDLLRCSPQVASLLTALTTYHRHLPQGAPTSSSLANLVLLDVDSRIHAAAAQAGCSYSRYVDDLVFSGDRPQDLIKATILTLRDSGFRVSRHKLSLMPAYSLQEVTGLAVNSRQDPSVPRQRRDQIRASIHQLAGRPRDGNFDRMVSSIHGRISNIASVNPEGARTLLQRLEDVAGKGESIEQTN